MLAAGVSQSFIPLSASGGSGLAYRPMIHGSAQVRYVDAKLKVETPIDISPSDLEASPEAGVGFVDLPANAVNARSRDGWGKDFATEVCAEDRGRAGAAAPVPADG